MVRFLFDGKKCFVFTWKIKHISLNYLNIKIKKYCDCIRNCVFKA